MTTASASDSLAQLWAAARAELDDFLCGFASPLAVARAIGQRVRAAIKRKLVMLEALVLKVLLIEAARLVRTIPAHWPQRARRNATARQPTTVRTEDAANPETWRVRFDLSPRTKRARPATARIRTLAPVLVRDIWRENARAALIARLRTQLDAVTATANAKGKAMQLARRFEAVRRTLADPRRAVVALARKLAALGRRARAFARTIALGGPRRGGSPAFACAIVGACHASTDLPGDDTS